MCHKVLIYVYRISVDTSVFISIIMDQEELFDLAEQKLSKFVRNFERNNAFDYTSLQNFKNLIEHIPGVEETKEFQELVEETEDFIYYGSHGGRKTSRDRIKIARMVELFLVIKMESLEEEEGTSSKAENIFLTICAFAWTMLMFAP